MKHSNGEGSVYKRSDGRWAASLMVNGKRHTVYAKTRAEAAEKLRGLQRLAHRAGFLPDSGRLTVNDLLAAWLQTAEPSLKPRTTETYRQLCDAYIRPAIGELRLSRLAPATVQRLIAPLQKQSKTRTAQKVYRVLHRACALAVLWGWLPSNPCDRIVKPKHTYRRREVWTQEELQRFLHGAREHRLYPLYLLLIAAGLRLGELLALEWADLDFRTGRLTIKCGVQRIQGEWVFSEPKTKGSIRVIALPPEVLAELRRHKAKQAEQRLRLGGE